jgi:hypothetical protein
VALGSRIDRLAPQTVSTILRGAAFLQVRGRSNQNFASALGKVRCNVIIVRPARAFAT